MTDPTAAVLTVLLYLQFKHFICDYPLQTHYHLEHKGTYGHLGGIVHSGLHAIFTIPAFLIMTPMFLVGVGIVVAEFLLHYHIDWTKQQVMKHMGWKAADREFWWGIGVDQLAHHLTYLGIATVLWLTIFGAPSGG